MPSVTLPAPTSTAPVNIPEPVGRALKAAINFTQSGHTTKALEALAAAAVTDIQQFNQSFLASAFEAAFMADLYDQALAKFACGGRRERTAPTLGPVPVAYVLPSIVQGQAAAQTIARLAELHDTSRVKVHVIVCEEHTARTPPLSMLQSPDSPSEVVGAELLARLHATGAGVHVVPTTGDLLSGARAAIAKAESLCLAGAAFIASPACPIQAVMLAARIAPVQVNLNIGVPMLCRGVDGVVYHNPARAAADGAVLAGRGTALHSLACTGTDTVAA
ncbi:MAG: hypothetical protein ACT4PL_04945, partial [Phycisphaerales bacterium]